MIITAEFAVAMSAAHESPVENLAAAMTRFAISQTFWRPTGVFCLAALSRRPTGELAGGNHGC